MDVSPRRRVDLGRLAAVVQLLRRRPVAAEATSPPSTMNLSARRRVDHDLDQLLRRRRKPAPPRSGSPTGSTWKSGSLQGGRPLRTAEHFERALKRLLGTGSTASSSLLLSSASERSDAGGDAAAAPDDSDASPIAEAPSDVDGHHSASATASKRAVPYEHLAARTALPYDAPVAQASRDSAAAARGAEEQCRSAQRSTPCERPMQLLKPAAPPAPHRQTVRKELEPEAKSVEQSFLAVDLAAKLRFSSLLHSQQRLPELAKSVEQSHLALNLVPKLLNKEGIEDVSCSSCVVRLCKEQIETGPRWVRGADGAWVRGAPR